MSVTAEIDDTTGEAWRRRALHGLVVLILLFLLLPIVIIVLLSFSSSKYLEFPPPGFSLQWYARFFHDPQWMTSLWLSVRVSAMCTALSVVLGVLASIVLVRERFPARRPAMC